MDSELTAEEALHDLWLEDACRCALVDLWAMEMLETNGVTRRSQIKFNALVGSFNMWVHGGWVGVADVMQDRIAMLEEIERVLEESGATWDPTRMSWRGVRFR